MKIVNTVTPVTTPAAGRVDAPTITAEPWKNPAAAAALRSSTQMLQTIEEGIVRNYAEADRARVFASDLHVAADIISAANDAIANDGNKDNDQFLPLLSRAGTGVSGAEERLTSKDLSLNWPIQRGDILQQIHTARVISTNIADQLDPNVKPPA